ncbi:hypothetical protein E2C01_044677 [Portunus trituberculatus]|uniref:Uncharacterized protein n=1 Tax=Portunus trituberculatus TaxID=210409 RepID=A0A5B7G0N0_PORTR|nr:hypothetical protein [Portunus trituberculatus]
MLSKPPARNVLEVACVILNVCIICIVDLTEAFNKPSDTTSHPDHSHHPFASPPPPRRHHTAILLLHTTIITPSHDPHHFAAGHLSTLLPLLTRRNTAASQPSRHRDPHTI